MRHIPTATAGLLAATVVLVGCQANPTPTEPTPTEPPDSTAPASAPPPAILNGADAAAITEALSTAWVAAVGGVAEHDGPAQGGLEALVALHDPRAVTVDASALGACIAGEYAALDAEHQIDLWEHSSWRDHGAEVVASVEDLGRLWSATVIDNLVAGSYGGSVYVDVVIGERGIVGYQAAVPDPEQGAAPAHVALVGCLVDAAAPTERGEALVAAAASGAPQGEGMGSSFDARAAFSNVAAAEGGEGSSGEVRRRDAFPADPADPEPIRSTGSNTWDLIRATDPTTFACLEPLGRGPEEFLPASKKGGYEAVPDAYLYRAHFADGTSIDMRVHPEIGTQADADAEIQRYLVPLGQLPTVLRQDIGRFAVRVGDNTATASQGEGMMLQTENATVRIGDNRLEETLFHEAVHTSLDPHYAYQRSAEWLAAQEADGRWLAEYGRENPDGEDLAETALYAYALTHHRDRLPAGMPETIEERVPHRLAFLDGVFPPGQPVMGAEVAVPVCG